MRHINGGMNFDNFGKNFNRVQTTAIGIIITNLVVGVVILALIVCGCVWGCKQVKEKGLKGIGNELWNGTETNQVEQVD